MALTAAFQERLEQMDRARSQRLCLLQAEKELHTSKFQVLESKYSNIRYMEQRCLMLEQKIASQNLRICVLKSEIDSLDAKYNSTVRRLRALRNDVEELEELEKERNRFYDEKTREMEEFKDNVSTFVVQCQGDTGELRNSLNKLLLNSMELQGPSGQYNGSEVAVAEMLRHELLAKKKDLDSELESNRQTRAEMLKLTSGS